MHLKNLYKGAKPIEKNVIVVDEQGNEYEATYPKRAKGLVKSGRARFVGENKICLACPPYKSEENKMMDNTFTNNALTIREIFEQITILQKQLTENSQTSLHRLGDALSTFEGEENESGYEQVEAVCDVFREREATISQMLAFYERMYDDIVNAENAEKKKMDMISGVFKPLISEIKNSDLDNVSKIKALADVSTKIRILAEPVLLNNTEEE